MRPQWRFIVVAVGTLGCGGGSPDPLEEVRRDSTMPVNARLVHGLVRDLSGQFDGLDAAAFMAKHAGLFGVDDVATELAPPQTTTEGAYTTVTYQRLTSGVPIFNAEIRLHEVSASVVLVTAPLPADSAIDTAVPTLTPAEAAERFNTAVGLATDTDVITAEVVAFNLGLFSGQATPTTLAYHVRSASYAPTRLEGFVDASTGALLLSYEATESVRARRVAHYEYQGACGQFCDQDGNCIDSCSLENVIDFAHKVWFEEAGSLPDATPSAQGSLLFNELGEVYDYYAGRFGRDGIDGNGALILAFLNHPEEAAESGAFWSYDDQAIFLRDRYVSPEAIAHEYTHGVVGAHTRLVGAGEAGAISEALADIMSVLVNGGAEWAIREADDTLIRNLAQPEIDHYDRYIPILDGRHAGSGPISLATYLLVVGGTHPRKPHPAIMPIAITKLEQIYYRAITKPYIQPGADMQDVLFGLVRSCADLVFDELHGIEPRDCGSIWNAFAAVGLGERDDDRDMFPNSVDNCDLYNPDQRDVDKNDEGDACEGATGPFPMEPPSVPTCAPFYHGATVEVATGEWSPEDWDLTGQSEVEAFEASSLVDGTPTTYYEFRQTCHYYCPMCAANTLDVQVRWQPYEPTDYGIVPLPYDYMLNCSLTEDLVTGQIGPFRSSTHYATIFLSIGLPDNDVYNAEQARYLGAMLDEVELHSAQCQ